MDVMPLVLVVILCALVFLLSLGIDHLVARTFRGRISLALFRGPGVIFHELCHVIACMVTRAKIMEVVWYNPYDGTGRVIHGNPKLPVFGNFLIAVAPFFGVALVLGVLANLFSAWTGVIIPDAPDFSLTQSTFVTILSLSWDTFMANLVTHPNPWFLPYLYLNITLLGGLAPSSTDIFHRDVALGSLFLFAIVYATVYYNLPYISQLLETFVTHLNPIMGFGLLSEVIALTLIVPAWALASRVR